MKEGKRIFHVRAEGFTLLLLCLCPHDLMPPFRLWCPQMNAPRSWLSPNRKSWIDFEPTHIPKLRLSCQLVSPSLCHFDNLNVISKLSDAGKNCNVERSRNKRTMFNGGVKGSKKFTLSELDKFNLFLLH